MQKDIRLQQAGLIATQKVEIQQLLEGMVLMQKVIIQLLLTTTLTQKVTIQKLQTLQLMQKEKREPHLVDALT